MTLESAQKLVVYGRPSCPWETSAACQVFVQLAIYILGYIKQGS